MKKLISTLFGLSLFITAPAVAMEATPSTGFFEKLNQEIDATEDSVTEDSVTEESVDRQIFSTMVHQQEIKKKEFAASTKPADQTTQPPYASPSAANPQAFGEIALLNVVKTQLYGAVTQGTLLDVVILLRCYGLGNFSKKEKIKMLCLATRRGCLEILVRLLREVPSLDQEILAILRQEATNAQKREALWIINIHSRMME
jgi:hypothetical protein